VVHIATVALATWAAAQNPEVFVLAARVTSPANALAGDDKYSGARRVGTAAKESAGGDDQDQQGKDCDQIDLSGVMTPGADSPGHCF
jgi:hypothetical protein